MADLEEELVNPGAWTSTSVGNPGTATLFTRVVLFSIVTPVLLNHKIVEKTLVFGY